MPEKVLMSDYLNSLVVSSSAKAALPSRYSCLILDFAERVVLSLSRSSQTLFTVAGVKLSSVAEDELCGLRIVFRVFDKPVQLFLPVELVELLVERFLGSDCKFILSQLTEREAVTISYLVGLILNDRSVFPKQRAYLQSVELIERQSVMSASSWRFSLGVAFEECRFEIKVGCCDELDQLFEQFAQRTIPSGSRKAWFTSLIGRTEIVATAQVSEINTLLHMEVRSRIPLRLKTASIGVSFGEDFLGNSRLPLVIDHDVGAESINLYLGG